MIRIFFAGAVHSHLYSLTVQATTFLSRFAFLLGLLIVPLMMAPSFAADYSAYESIYLAPVVIDEELENRPVRRVGRSSYRDDRAVRASDLSAKSSDLQAAIVSALENGSTLVEAPGTGVLTIEPVLTELRSSRPTLADFDREVSLSARSEYAGGAKVIFKLSENGSELETYKASWFGDIERNRRKVGIWEDANRAFRIISRKLARHVQS